MIVHSEGEAFAVNVIDNGEYCSVVGGDASPAARKRYIGKGPIRNLNSTLS